jgi:hypothetical protein
MAAVYKWRKKTGAAGPVIINNTQLPNRKKIGYPSIQCLRSAELFLLERAQKEMKTSRTKSLNVDTVTEEDVNGIKRKLTVIGTRGRNQIQGMYGQTNLPVLAKDHKLKPQPKGKARGKPTLMVKCKKVSSWKKAGEQTHTIVVTVPKEEEEIVDVKAVKRKRGRPRKTPGTEPLDPRKGSVLDPGKGVCADPVERVAILKVKGRGPPGGVSERQLSPDRGGEKT